MFQKQNLLVEISKSLTEIMYVLAENEKPTTTVEKIYYQVRLQFDD